MVHNDANAGESCRFVDCWGLNEELLLCASYGSVGDDAEECDVTATQKRHMMEFAVNLLSILFQFVVKVLSYVIHFLICFCLQFTFSNSIW
jgi:hypothetical protein